MRVIEVEDLGKRYQLGEEPFAHGSLRETLSGLMRRGRNARGREDLWALRHISFGIDQGQTVGVIGRNGAGKSTMLSASRITEPTEGVARVRGRVGALLEVGTAFHPELTGRENISINGALLGMSKRDISARFDEIVEFAGVQRFLDTPVQRYSSGMYLRLAFAVAAHFEPEVVDGSLPSSSTHRACYLGLKVRGDSECQPQVHARRVALDRCVEEALNAGELDDLVEPGADVNACSSPTSAPLMLMFSRPVSSGWNAVPTSSKAPTRPRTRATPSVGSVIRAQGLHGCIARSVAADDTDRLALIDAERGCWRSAHRSSRPRALRPRRISSDSVSRSEPSARCSSPSW